MSFPNKNSQFVKGKSGNPDGRPIGSKNRATIVREFLDTEVTRENAITGMEEKLSLEEHITLSMLKEALSGIITAYKAIMDNAYGSISNSQENAASIDEEQHKPTFILEIPCTREHVPECEGVDP